VLARLLLLPLVTVVLLTALVTPFHSAPSVDTRTYLEMTAGIAKNGLPYLSNGQPSRFAEMQARWNISHGDTLWGSLPPIFPYLAAPLLKIGGLRLVSMFEIALTAALALAVFAIGARAAKDPIVGTAAAYVTVGATPVTGISFDLGPYMLSIVFFAWAMYFALRAIDDPPRGPHFGGMAGLLGGLAVGTHLTSFAMFAPMMAVLALMPVEGARPIVKLPPALSWIEPWLPTGATVSRGAAAVIGAAVPLGFVAVIDHARFGSWNPVTYGPCVWRSCEESGVDRQSVRFMLEFARPAIELAVLSAIGVRVAIGRRSKTLVLVVIALAIMALVRSETLRVSVVRLAETGLAFLIDTNHLDLAPYVHAPDGLGVMTGSAVLKSPLQNAPFLALAFVAPFATTRERRNVVLIAAPCLGLLFGLSLRANLPPVMALGFSYTHLRYTFPALPMAVVLAVWAARRLTWGRRQFAILVGLAVVVGLVLASGPSDAPYWRRVLLLRVTLLVAAAALLLAWLARRTPASPRRASLAGTAAAVALGLSFAINLGLDDRKMLIGRTYDDRLVDSVAAVFPERFALVGWASQIDTPLSLRVTRDVEYADMYEAKDWSNFRTLIDKWTDEGRPIFCRWPIPDPPRQVEVESPWKEIAFDKVGDPKLGIVRVRKRDPSEL
jgi:hypothetical protein